MAIPEMIVRSTDRDGKHTRRVFQLEVTLPDGQEFIMRPTHIREGPRPGLLVSGTRDVNDDGVIVCPLASGAIIIEAGTRRNVAPAEGGERSVT